MIIRCAILTTAMSAVSSTAFSETWSCERTVPGDKTEQMKWVVSGDQMRAFTPGFPAGAKPFRVVQNNNRVIVAFYRGSRDLTLYIIVDKTSGSLIEMDDLPLNVLGESAKPDVYIGHCVQTAP